MAQAEQQLSFRSLIDEQLEEGDYAGARVSARRYWEASPDASVARFIKSRTERLWHGQAIRTRRLAVLRSFTLEPVLPLLQAEAALAGIRLDAWIGDFNAYGQEILDPASPLYAHQPEAVILAVQTRDIAPKLWSNFVGLSEDQVRSEIETAAGALLDLLRQLRAASPASIIAHGLERPLHVSRGLLDLRSGVGQADAISQINLRLREWCANQSDVYFLDYDELQARHGRLRFIDEKKWATAKLPLSASAVGWLAAEWWRYLGALFLPAAKVLVLDLDNTLWGGIVGEDGLEGIKLNDEYSGVFFKHFQRVVLDLAERGVILAIASKNNPADALQVLNEHPDMLVRGDKFAAMRINWDPKVASLASIADELNLGLDSFIFVDDNPAECEAVRRALPQVEVIELPTDPSTYADLLRRTPRLERMSVTSEDAERGRYYSDERHRRELESSVDTLEDFLNSLRIEIEIAPIDTMALARSAQLTQKTNQLNTTTRRYSEAQLAEQLRQPSWKGYALRASDRFGDNGLVGVALLNNQGELCEIDTFLMSCRVIGRGIETAFLHRLAELARNEGARELAGWFIPTAKNAPAAQIYARAGFLLRENRDGSERWGIDLKDELSAPHWISIRSSALSAQ